MLLSDPSSKCSTVIISRYLKVNIYLGVATLFKSGGATHTRERSDQVGEGVGGFPPHTVWKIFHFQEP